MIPKFAGLYTPDLNIDLAPGDSHSDRHLPDLPTGPYLLAAIAMLVLLAAAAFAWSQSEQGGLAVERIRMRLPLVGETITKFQFAQFCRTLSTLLAGGTPLVQAMETAGGAIQKPYLVWAPSCRARSSSGRGSPCTAASRRRDWCLISLWK